MNNKILGLKNYTKMIWIGESTEYTTKGKTYAIRGRQREKSDEDKYRYSYKFKDDTGQEQWGMSFMFVASKK